MTELERTGPLQSACPWGELKHVACLLYYNGPIWDRWVTPDNKAVLSFLVDEAERWEIARWIYFEVSAAELRLFLNDKTTCRDMQLKIGGQRWCHDLHHNAVPYWYPIAEFPAEYASEAGVVLTKD